MNKNYINYAIMKLLNKNKNKDKLYKNYFILFKLSKILHKFKI